VKQQNFEEQKEEVNKLKNSKNRNMRVLYRGINDVRRDTNLGHIFSG